MRGLSLTFADLQYAFTFGARIHLGHRTAIVLRHRDFPTGALDLDSIARREGIVLVLNRHGLVVDIWRDRDACRKFRSTRGDVSARPRHHRLG
jgi:hypothetical protein